MRHPIDRRLFLKTGLVGIGSSLMVARSPFAEVFSPRAAGRRVLPSDNGRRLVVVQLRGGNDGLNTVVPFTETAYRSLRPNLALPEHELLQIGGEVALNPALAPLLPHWERGQFAIVPNVGYPDPDLSHFRSEAIWYTANPQAPSGNGWLGAWIHQRSNPSPAALTSISYLPSPATAAQNAVAAAVRDPDQFGFEFTNPVPEDSELRRELLHQGFLDSVGRADSLSSISATGLAAESVVDLVGRIPEEEVPPVAYPESVLAGDLAIAARFLASDVGARVVWVTTGGFDTHADQGATHSNLLGELAGALDAFLEDLDVRGLSARTAVMVWSEFGRRVQENGSLGTDHGTGGASFFLGAPVNGGIYGDLPDLHRLDENGNLVFDVDFRSLYETVFAKHLGVDPRLVLEQPFERLGIFR